MKPISVIIITKNEEKNIYDCLKSVEWADEIVIVDSGSSDKTISIANQFTNKIFTNEFKGFAEQKKFALQKSTNEWVLSLDADERITKELQTEIMNLNFDEYDGFYISRMNYFLDKAIKGCGWSPDYQLRLFRKSKTTLTDRLIHEGFKVDGKVGYLKNQMTHLTHIDLKDTFYKINEYTSLSALEKVYKTKVGAAGLLLRPAWDFFHHFIFRKGFRDGVYGLMVSLIHSMTKLQTYLKIWELRNVSNKRNFVSSNSTKNKQRK